MSTLYWISLGYMVGFLSAPLAWLMAKWVVPDEMLHRSRKQRP